MASPFLTEAAEKHIFYILFFRNVPSEGKNKKPLTGNPIRGFRKSGRRDSNPRPSAWKANALSTELLPHDCELKEGGQ